LILGGGAPMGMFDSLYIELNGQELEVQTKR
jgi:hypothetical protein